MTDTITSELLYQAILHGATRTRERRDDLNRINVFPVVDNDTGSNLAHTMHYILSHARQHDDVRSTLKEVARAALIGARGNSGAIFSQYFNGLYQGSSESNAVTLAELAACFQEAYTRAYKAIEEPVEGTVITLMRAWAVSFAESVQQRKALSLRAHFESSLAQISQTLEETRQTLKIMKKHGVVDAGALGYYYFMDGFVQVILGLGSHQAMFADLRTASAQAVQVSVGAEQMAGQLADGPAASLASDQAADFVSEDIHLFEAGADIPFRYCTEVLLEFASLDQAAFRQALSPLGDCLLLASADNLIRVHLHTNQPWEVIRLAAARGRILEHKADDMVAQNRLAGPPETGIACVTDSIADLPPDFIFQHHIYQLPINIMIDGVSYLDKLTIDSAFLHEHLALASSAQLNTAQIHSFLGPILKHYARVLILTVSSQMSGTYSRFKEALAGLEPDAAARIALIDTRVNSGAQGLLVRSAVEMIAAGQPFDQVVAAMEALRNRARIVVSVLDIEPMARSGRVSERIGNLLVRLQFKPLITISPEGKGTIRGVAFSVQQNWKILLKSLRGRARVMADYVIVHAAAADRADRLRAEMVRLTGREPLYITEISSVVTLFAGRGSVAVAYLEKE